MNDELNDAVNNVVNGLGAACELSGFLLKQLIKNDFTREEAVQIVKEYLLGMITGGKNGN